MSSSTSTTTERRPAWRTFARHAAIALGAWFALLAALTPVAPPATMVIAFGAPARLLTGANDARIRQVRPRYVVFEIGDAADVRALYAQGAWLVLPATRGGCRGGYRPFGVNIAAP